MGGVFVQLEKYLFFFSLLFFCSSFSSSSFFSWLSSSALEEGKRIKIDRIKGIDRIDRIDRMDRDVDGDSWRERGKPIRIGGRMMKGLEEIEGEGDRGRAIDRDREIDRDNQ